MQGVFTTKSLGAIIVGLALVGGAYTVNSFGEPTVVAQPANTISTTMAPRAPIVVSDNDQNGIEDWRDEFLTEEAIVVSVSDEEYVPPSTLTGRTGIHLAESIVHSRTIGRRSVTDQDIIDSTVNSLNATVNTKLHSIEDILVMTDWNDQDIVNYANAVALVIYKHENPELGYELDILDDVLNKGNIERLTELDALAQVYRATLEDTVLLPVPEFLTKQHLDLVNSYQAVTEDVEAMLLSKTDPIITLIHLRRYQDSALAMYYALENMYTTLEPHADLFTINDAALFFVQFSPDYQP